MRLSITINFFIIRMGIAVIVPRAGQESSATRMLTNVCRTQTFATMESVSTLLARTIASVGPVSPETTAHGNSTNVWLDPVKTMGRAPI